MEPRGALSLNRALHTALVESAVVARRLDFLHRDAFDRLVRPVLVAALQWVIRRRLPDHRLGLAEERELAGEAEATRLIVERMRAYTRREYATATAERAGNTKTYGLVHGVFTVLPGLAPHLRHGVFAEPRSFDAWVRFGGPGPASPPDIRDNGILSLGIKLLGVPGEKLLDEETQTQDFTAISAPTFTTADVVENAKLQRRLEQGLPAFHFLDPRDPHLLDALMQGLYARAHANPLGATYWSCTPILLGAGQAVQFSVRPVVRLRDRVPPRPAANYLRHAMARTLARGAVDLEFRVQLQTDARRMPVEHASVIWSERRSPPVVVARLHLPAQRFDTPEQLAFARSLSFQPWHCVADHRPLGNQNRARRVIYAELSRLRQTMNGDPRIEPQGSAASARSAEIPGRNR